MSRAYYSAVLPHPAEVVWAVIRPFDHYAWSGVTAPTTIENGSAPDEVGSIRQFDGPRGPVRQVLIAHSDAEHRYSYGFVTPAPMGMRNYHATIRVAPVVESGQAFVEWFAEFDVPEGDGEAVARRLEAEGLAVWLNALGRFMEARDAA